MVIFRFYVTTLKFNILKPTIKTIRTCLINSAKCHADVLRLHDYWVLHPRYQELLHISGCEIRHDDSDIVPDRDLRQDVLDEWTHSSQDYFM